MFNEQEFNQFKQEKAKPKNTVETIFDQATTGVGNLIENIVTGFYGFFGAEQVTPKQVKEQNTIIAPILNQKSKIDNEYNALQSTIKGNEKALEMQKSSGKNIVDATLDDLMPTTEHNIEFESTKLADFKKNSADALNTIYGRMNYLYNENEDKLNQLSQLDVQIKATEDIKSKNSLINQYNSLLSDPSVTEFFKLKDKAKEFNTEIANRLTNDFKSVNKDIEDNKSNFLFNKIVENTGGKLLAGVLSTPYRVVSALGGDPEEAKKQFQTSLDVSQGIQDYLEQNSQFTDKYNTPNYYKQTDYKGYKLLVDEYGKAYSVRDENLNEVQDKNDVLAEWNNLKDKTKVEDKFNTYSTLATTGQVMADMAPLFAGGYITNGSRAAAILLGGSTIVAQTQNDVYDSVKDRTDLTEREKNAYAMAVSTGLAALNMAVTPKFELNLLGATSSAEKNVLKKFINENAVKYASGEISGLQVAKEYTKYFLKNAGKEIPEEVLEEWLFEPIVQNTITDITNKATGSNIEMQKIDANSMKDVLIPTVLATGLMSGASSYRGKNELQLEALNDAVNNVDKFNQITDGLIGNGVLNEQKGIETKNVVSKIANTLDQANITNETDRRNLTNLLFQNETIRVRMDSNISDDLKSVYKKQISSNQAIIDKLLNNELVPTNVLQENKLEVPVETKQEKTIVETPIATDKEITTIQRKIELGKALGEDVSDLENQLKTKQDAIKESDIKKQESSTESNISQREGIVQGQQESQQIGIGEQGNSEKSGTDISNSNQQSQIQNEEKVVEQSLPTPKDNNVGVEEGSGGVGGDVVKPTFENVPILTRTAEEIETAKNEVFNNLNRLEVGSVIENSDGEIKVVTEKSTDKKGNQLIGIVTYERQSDGSLRQMTNIVWASKSADGKIKLDYNPHSTGTNLKGERVTVTDQITDKKIDLSKENIFTEDENGNLIQINKVEPSLKETTQAETPTTTSNQSEIEAKKTIQEIPRKNISFFVSGGSGVDHQSYPENKATRDYDISSTLVKLDGFRYVEHSDGTISFHIPYNGLDVRSGSHLGIAIKGFKLEQIDSKSIKQVIDKLGNALAKISKNITGDERKNEIEKIGNEVIDAELKAVEQSLKETPKAETKVGEVTPTAPKELTLEQKKHNRIADLVKSFNELTNRQKAGADGSNIRQDIIKLSSELGYSIANDGKKISVTNDKGKQVKKIGLREEKPLSSQEDIDYAMSEIGKGRFDWNGSSNEFRVNLGISWSDIRQGVKDLKDGKPNSLPAKRLVEAIAKTKEQGGYEIVAGSGSLMVKEFVPFDQLDLTYELSADEEQQILENQAELEAEANEYFNNLTEEEQIQILQANGQEITDTGSVEQSNSESESETDVSDKESTAEPSQKVGSQVQDALTEVNTEIAITNQLLTKAEKELSKLKEGLSNNLKENQIDAFGQNKPQALFNDKGNQQAIVDAKQKEVADLKDKLAKLKENKTRLEDSVNQMEMPLFGKSKIADGLSDLGDILGSKLSAYGEKRPELINALTKIGQGLIEMGLATIDNVIQKIKEQINDPNINIDDYKDAILANMPTSKEQAIKNLVDKWRADGMSDKDIKTILSESETGKTFIDKIFPTEPTERSFTRSLDDVDKEVEAIAENKTYVPTTNKAQESVADEFIQTNGVEEATKLLLENNLGDLSDAETNVVAMKLIKLNNANKNYKESARIFDIVAEKLTEAGRLIQTASLWNLMDPQGAVEYALRLQSKGRVANQKVVEAEVKTIQQKITEIARDINSSKEIKDAIARIYNKKERISKTKSQKAIDWLESIKVKGMAFSAVPGINLLPATYNTAINIIQTGIKANIMLSTAVDQAVKYIRENITADESFDESKFKKFILDSLPKIQVDSIKVAQEELGTKISEVVNAHYTIKNEYKKSLLESILSKTDLTEDEAKIIEKIVEDRFKQEADKKLAWIEKKQKNQVDKLDAKIEKVKRELSAIENGTFKQEKKYPVTKSEKQLELEALRKQKRELLGSEQPYVKIIDRINKGQVSNSDIKELLYSDIGLSNIDEVTISKIEELHQKVKDAPEGSSEQRDRLIDLMDFIDKQINGTNNWDIARSLLYASLLSGTGTQAKNFISNTIQSAAETYVNAVLLASKGDFKGISQIVKGMIVGLERGMLEAGKVMSTGYDPNKKILLLDNNPKISKKDILESYSGKIKPISWAKYVRRIMVAADTLFYYGVKEMESYALARKIARDSGLKGKALQDKMNEILLNGQHEFKAQAISEGYIDPKNQKRRIFELIEANRNRDLTDKADIAALKATYNNEPTGLLGHISRGLQSMNSYLTQKNKALGLAMTSIIPFTRVISNVVNEQLNWTPLGYARALTEKGSLFGSEDQLPINGEERAKLAIKATTGLLLATGLLALALKGDDDEDKIFDITANGYGTSYKNSSLYPLGWKPYTIGIKGPDGNWIRYNYQNTPFGQLFGMIGTIADNQKYNKGDDITDKLGAFSTATINQMFNASALQGASTLFDALANKDSDNGNKIMEFFISKAKTPIPNILKEAYNIFDNQLYDKTDIKGMVVNNVPVFQMLGKPKLNVFGEPIEKSRYGALLLLPKTDDTFKRLYEADVVPRMPLKNKKIYGQEMNNEQFYDYVKVRGQKLRELTEQNLDYVVNSSEPKKVYSNIENEASSYAEQIIYNKYFK